MQKLKVTIEITLKSDPEDEVMLKEDIYNHLQGLMEDDALDYNVEDPEEDEEDDF